MTVHSRGGLQDGELGHSPHKKSLLIYFPPNWKVHAHTWLNHHASTGDGPPPHTGETWAQHCCTVLGQPGRKNTRMHCTPCNGFCRCPGPDSPVLNMAPIIEESFIKFVILLFFHPHLSLCLVMNALSLFLGLPLLARSYYPFLCPTTLLPSLQFLPSAHLSHLGQLVFVSGVSMLSMLQEKDSLPLISYSLFNS